MALQNLGAPPSRPKDYVDLDWISTSFPSYSSTVSSGTDFTITLPVDPVDHTMYLLEVYSTATIVVTVPGFVTLTVGVPPMITVYTGKTAFFGFRYSVTAGAWFLLSATVQV